ncbi:MAG: Maf family protein [Anaerohalosphaeraceae bacterium]
MKPNGSFILASASPRRKLLLQQAGYRFEVIPSQVDESKVDICGLTCEQAAARLALAKAQDVAASYPDCLVLAADTVVDSDGTLIGKPADVAEAEAILRRLFRKPHRVITGIALVRKSRNLEICESCITWVYPKTITEEQLAAYLASGDWQGKAGAYGIQEINDAFVERIDGSFSNVVGLPMERVEPLLRQWGAFPAAGGNEKSA